MPSQFLNIFPQPQFGVTKQASHCIPLLQASHPIPFIRVVTPSPGKRNCRHHHNILELWKRLLFWSLHRSRKRICRNPLHYDWPAALVHLPPSRSSVTVLNTSTELPSHCERTWMVGSALRSLRRPSCAHGLAVWHASASRSVLTAP